MFDNYDKQRAGNPAYAGAANFTNSTNRKHRFPTTGIGDDGDGDGDDPAPKTKTPPTEMDDDLQD